jgi:hypothetical protein
MPRYLNLSELAHVRWLASEAVRWRRPRRAQRVRGYAPQLAGLYRVLDGLRRLEVSAA